LNRRVIAITDAVIVLVIGIVLWKARDWWVAKKAVTESTIRAQENKIVARDIRIAALDKTLDSLRKADSTLKATEKNEVKLLMTSMQGWAQAKAQIELDTHDNLVPIMTVRLAETKADSTITNCRNLNTTKDARIANLVSQGVVHDTIRVEVNATRATLDSVVVETKELYVPPWWKRSFSWAQDHATTLLIGGAGGYVLAKR